MAQMTIQLQPLTGGRMVLRVALTAEEDTTPREHEQDHRRAVRTLFPGLDLDSEGERVTVEREKPEQEPMLGCSCGDDGYEVIDLG